MTVNPGIYQHYKGDFYVVLGVAKHTEKDSFFVVYHKRPSQYPPELHARPLKMFTENVAYEGKVVPRFKHLTLEGLAK